MKLHSLIAKSLYVLLEGLDVTQALSRDQPKRSSKKFK
jgi:hypothetical protein